jgi:NAD(P)-dependent dehydrogenase (short-subunit alcohol dehydrogenase family)
VVQVDEMGEAQHGLAILTGSSGGVGSALIGVLRGRGWRVVGLDRVAPGKGCQEPDAFYEVDLSHSAEATRLLERILQSAGERTTLLNVAGRFGGIGLDALDQAYLADVFAVNLFTPLWLTKTYAEDRIRRKLAGSVVNVASVTAQSGAFDVGYAASKAGVISMTKSLGREYAAAGVRIIAVSPGQIDTQMLSVLDPELRRCRVNAIPLHRPAQPIEIAYAIEFLASDRASFIVGATLDANGGIY